MEHDMGTSALAAVPEGVMRSAKLRRLHELFEVGELVTVGDGESVEHFWVKKLNSFEYDEALKDGRYARGLRMESYRHDPKQKSVIEGLAQSFATDELVAALMDHSAGELWMKSNDAVRTAKEWQERLDIIDRAELLDERMSVTAEERSAAENVTREFWAAVLAERNKRAEDLQRDYEALSRDELEAKWVDVFLQNTAATEFMSERRKTEVFYALCDAEAELVDGEWKILPGDHPRILEHRNQVAELPEELFLKVCAALDRQMTPDQAGNSDAPSASSGSSEQPSAQEDSPRSTRPAPPARPAGTSSTPSRKR